MFVDTHAHLSMVGERTQNLPHLLTSLKESGCPFILDIGTEPGDLQEHKNNTLLNGKPLDFIYYSAGLWPSAPVIANQKEGLLALEKDLDDERVVALGECGLDRRETNKENGGDLAGEKELFLQQIEIAKRRDLPLIIHSRDDFSGTLECLQKKNYHRGIIHCFSYGVEEAKKFLELGWYISFAGTITFKKTEALQEALSIVPDDKLLLETDAPYLAPVPHRGKVNTPLLIEETYKKAADIRGTTVEKLCQLVEQNTKRLFFS